MAYSNLATKTIMSGIESHSTGTGFGINFPYLKYAWELSIVDTKGKNHSLNELPPLVARTVELPRWATDTQIVNAYNHKTVVQTRFNWEPVTISFYDQINKSAECLIWHFVMGQFDAEDGSKKASYKPLTLEIRMKNLSGESPNGEKDKIYRLKNAYITDAQHDTLDYSTSDVVLWTVTMRYEDVEIAECGFKGTPPIASTGMKKREPPIQPKPPVVAMPEKKIDDQPDRRDPDERRDSEAGRRFAKPTNADRKAWIAATGGVLPFRDGRQLNTDEALADWIHRGRPAYNAPPGPSIGSRIKNFVTWPKPDENKDTDVINRRSYVDERRAAALRQATPGDWSRNSPSTGPDEAAKGSVQPAGPKPSFPPSPPKTPEERKVVIDQFVKEEAKFIESQNYNPEFKKAYIAALEGPARPRTTNPQSLNTARSHAETIAMGVSPKHSDHVRITEGSGRFVDVPRSRSTAAVGDPSPAPVVGMASGVERLRPNDLKGSEVVEKQKRQEAAAAARTRAESRYF